jgi:hypothetical protein
MLRQLEVHFERVSLRVALAFDALPFYLGRRLYGSAKVGEDLAAVT